MTLLRLLLTCLQQPRVQNFTLVGDSREKLKRQVFQQSNAPIYTVEEWAEQQMAKGLLPSGNVK